MAGKNINEIVISQANQGECSDPTVEIKIRTLDSQSYVLRVNRCVPVPALKEQIATITGVVSEQQRLICRGKVLKDDQLLSAYHVEDGHTLHLVVRQPLQQPIPSMTRTSVSNGNAEPQGSDPLSGAMPSRSGQVSSVVLGTFNIADRDDGNIPDLNRLVSNLLNFVGIGNPTPIGAGNGNESTEIAQGIGFETQERVTSRSLISDVNQTQFDYVSDVQFDPSHGSIRFSPVLYSRRFNQPVVISDSLTTLTQYLNRIGHEFALNGSESQPRSTASQSSDADALGGASDLLSVSEGLSMPATLGMVIRCTQELLTSQFGSSLSQLARQLEGEASITDPEARREIQSAAMRNGVMMQNMGALLLELGRTTMTLQMRESSAESVVNAGPSVFVSAAGPNPLMVQTLPFQTGSSFGSIPVGAIHSAVSGTTGSTSAGDVLRNIDIHIRTGSPLAPSSNSEQGEHVTVQQVDGQGNQVGSAQGEIFSRSGVSSVLGESGALRVVPVRTVVATVPEALNGRSPTESSGSSVGVFYPLLTRFQQLNPLQLTQIRGAPQTLDTEIHSRGAETVHAPLSIPLPTSRAQVQLQSSVSTANQNVRMQEHANSLVNMTLAGQTQTSLNGAPQSHAGSIVEEHISEQAPSSVHVYDIHCSPQNMQEDHEQRNGERAASEGNSFALLPTGINHIFSGMASERHSGTLGGDIVHMMSEMLHNSSRSDISRPAAVPVGEPSGSTNVIEHTMQNSFSSNQLQMSRQMGERNRYLSEVNSALNGNQGMADFSGLLQRLMPSISQVIGRESEALTSHHGSEALTSHHGSEAQPMASSSEYPSSGHCGTEQLKTSSEGQISAERNDEEISMTQGDIDSRVLDGCIHSDAERQQSDPSDEAYPESSRASKRQRVHEVKQS